MAKVLTALGNASANLDCVIARRDPAKSGTGVVFLTPVKGTAAEKLRNQLLIARRERRTLKVEGDDAAGLGGRMATAIADAGINLARRFRRGDRKKFVAYLGFDSAADATKATRVLKTLASQRKPEKPSADNAFCGEEIEEAQCLLRDKHELVALGIGAHGEMRRFAGRIRRRFSEKLTAGRRHLARTLNDVCHLEAESRPCALTSPPPWMPMTAPAISTSLITSLLTKDLRLQRSAIKFTARCMSAAQMMYFACSTFMGQHN